MNIVRELTLLLNENGRLILAETVSKNNQRLYDLLQSNWLASQLLEKLKQAEEAVYQNSSDLTINWSGVDLKQDLARAGLSVKIELKSLNTSMLITPGLISRWFSSTQTTQPRLTYRSHLEKILSVQEVDLVQETFVQHLCHKTVSCESTIAYLNFSNL